MWTSGATVSDMEPHTAHAHSFPENPGSEVEGTHLQWHGGLPSIPVHPPHSSPERLSASSAWRLTGLPGRGPTNRIVGLEHDQPLRGITEQQRWKVYLLLPLNHPLPACPLMSCSNVAATVSPPCCSQVQQLTAERLTALSLLGIGTLDAQVPASFTLTVNLGGSTGELPDTKV